MDPFMEGGIRWLRFNGGIRWLRFNGGIRWLDKGGEEDKAWGRTREGGALLGSRYF
jgi:hypothetical protein